LGLRDRIRRRPGQFIFIWLPSLLRPQRMLRASCGDGETR